MASSAGARNRSSSVSRTVDEINTYTDGSNTKEVQNGSDAGKSKSTAAKAVSAKKYDSKAEELMSRPRGSIFYEFYTLRWMVDPISSLKIAISIVLCWVAFGFIAPDRDNPFTHLLFISHQVPTAQVIAAEPMLAAKVALDASDDPAGLTRYQKGYWDLGFIAFYIIVFSFIRQSITLYIFKPFAKWYGITSEMKQVRLMEQGYAFVYWGTFGALGVYVMQFQDSWWYKLEHLWLKYPHWQMRPELKYYYLLQFSYWLQQALVMLLRLEKPRKDYYELVAHHLVTLWLIGWSYLINLTMIGTTVFVCMDIPDTFLAASKFLNYIDSKAVPVVFASFMAIWTYFRIYLSALTLHSVWFQFDLIPEYAKEWNPPNGWWLVWWMKYQVFTPLFLLFCLNCFWYFLMWRIMIRALGGTFADEREEGEYDDDEIEKKKKQK